MEGLGNVIILALLMFWVSLGTGMIPIVFEIGNRSIHLLKLLASGLLIGTGLTIVIPEGAEALDSISDSIKQPSNTLGFTLLLGFLFMLFIDWLSNSHGHSHANYASLNSLPLQNSQKSLTIGLLIHAAADGIAFGASKASGNITEVTSLVIFLAIICHKMPAAISLTTLLKVSGQSDTSIQRSLFIFSAAAPVMALTTFVSLRSIEHNNVAEIGSFFSAICLIFSGGTFIYVSCVHLLGELDLSNLSKADFITLCSGCVVPLLLMTVHEV